MPGYARTMFSYSRWCLADTSVRQPHYGLRAAQRTP